MNPQVFSRAIFTDNMAYPCLLIDKKSMSFDDIRMVKVLKNPKLLFEAENDIEVLNFDDFNCIEMLRVFL